MTGIERLRKHGDNLQELLEALASDARVEAHAIAEQIKREAQPKRDPAADVSMSAYDLLPADEREAIAWVREHGGLGHVKDICHDFRAVVERLGIEWSESELHGLMDVLDKRLMPEGMEWPKVDGEPVVIGERLVGYGSGDDGYEVVGVRPTCGWVLVKSCDHIRRDGGPVILEWDASKCHRLAPKVLDADGAEIRVGDTLYYVDGREQKVNTVAYLTDGLVQFGRINGAGYVTYCEGACISPDQLTHRAPVLAADGKPLREGETVWHRSGNAHGVVESIDAGSLMHTVRYRSDDGEEYRDAAKDLTHERPDSWERLEEDVAGASCPDVYCANHRIDASDTSYEWAMARDIVRRARALAGEA